MSASCFCLAVRPAMDAQMDLQTTGQTGNVTLQMLITARPWECSSLPLCSQNSLYVSLCLHYSAEQSVFQLHINVLVYRLNCTHRGESAEKPTGSVLPFFPAISDHFTSFSFFSLFFCPHNQLSIFPLSFLSPSSPFTPYSPSTAFPPLHFSSSFPPVSPPLFLSELHALTYAPHLKHL